MEQLRGRSPCSTLLAGRPEYRLARPARSPGNGVPGGRGRVVEDGRGNAQGRPHTTPPGAGLKQTASRPATRCGPNAARERRRRPEPEPAVTGDRDESRRGERARDSSRAGVCSASAARFHKREERRLAEDRQHSLPRTRLAGVATHPTTDWIDDIEGITSPACPPRGGHRRGVVEAGGPGHLREGVRGCGRRRVGNPAAGAEVHRDERAGA